jgi:hypothetical protein
MTDAQFQELLHHIDGIGTDVFLSAAFIASSLFWAIFIHAWTRK